MRFRYKVTMINIAFLSLALGVLGFIIVRQNFKHSMELQVTYAIEENNLIQSSIEYQMLDYLNGSNPDLSEHVEDIGMNTDSAILTQFSSFYIVYNKQLLFSSVSDITTVEALPESLFGSLTLGSKNYMICKEKEHFFIYVASENIIENKDFHIITKRNVDDSYQLLYSQIQLFLILMVIVLLICSIFLYWVSQYLTKPLEKLNDITDRFAEGDYQIQSHISSNDEIGMLAEKFNHMALSVSGHIDELNEMVKQHEQFVADFTHEIKTPMTTIIGYADMLQSKDLNEERQKLAYHYIYSEGKRLETMSMKLFDLIYLKEHDVLMSELHTSILANEIYASVQPILDRKQITLKTSVADCIIYGETELLKTVFINLIDNARKASKEGTVIELNGLFETDSYVLQVVDHGCGMDEETIAHICDEFYMADKSRSRAEGGAGLGMSLSALIIAKHHATLDITSSIGNGTTISIHFHEYEKTTAQAKEEFL